MIGRVHLINGKVGTSMPGLVRYLVGPGKENEHADPRVVASSGTLAAEFAGTDWDAAKAGDLSRVVDGAWRKARRVAGLPLVPGQDETTATGAARPDHVFHVSLSLAADEGRLPDEKWAAIAQDYVKDMGFTADSGKAECQWVAFHHGLSKKGNDHIHIAVCLVREDGTRASDWQSKARTRKAVDRIEAKHGLRPVRDSTAERGLPGYHAAEAGKARRQGRAEPGVLEVARRVRAVALVAVDESDFVRTARESGLLLRPRFAAGGTGKVTGYSAALRPVDGGQPVWHGGGELHKTLRLPALRRRWEHESDEAARDGSTTASESAARAVAEWRRANPSWGADPGAGPRESARWARLPKVDLSVEAARDVARLNLALAKVDPSDRAMWQAAARETSGLLALWSTSVEGDRPGPLARASDALARSAQPTRDDEGPAEGLRLAGRHARLLARAAGTGPMGGWVAVLRQLDATMHAIRAAHEARGEAVRAAELARRLGEDLHEVRRELAMVGAPGTPAPTTREATSADVGGPDVRRGTAPAPARASTSTTSSAVPARHRSAAAAAEQTRREQAAQVLRSVWPADQAEQVISGAAFGAVAYRLDQLQRSGKDPAAVLQQIPPGDITSSSIRHPAAFLAHRLDQLQPRPGGALASSGSPAGAPSGARQGQQSGRQGRSASARGRDEHDQGR